MTRTYGQLCPLARALDHVGDRWTLLIVRDLASGPRRYSDLLAGLPGIGTTLLGDRLRRLGDEGLIDKRDLPAPAASTVYELTTAGHELLTALVPLAAWGLRYLDEMGDDDIRLESVLLFIRSSFDSAAGRGVHDVYEFHVGAHRFHVAVVDGDMTAAPGPAPRSADAVIRAPWPALVQLALGTADPEELVGNGDVALDGDPDALRRCYRILVGGRVLGGDGRSSRAP